LSSAWNDSSDFHACVLKVNERSRYIIL
jgi:hypothetical protein